MSARRDLIGATGGSSGSLEAPNDLPVQLLDPLLGGGSHVPGHGGIGRNDVGGASAVGDDTVDLVGGVHGLA